MKITKTFENATLRTVNNGYIELDYNGKTHYFHNASVISINNGIITMEVDWEPKEGELVKIFTKANGIRYAIFKDIETNHFWMYCASFSKLTCLPCDYIMPKWYNMDEISNIFPVTPEEQQAFDDFCKSKGKIWNKEKLQWEKYRWKPVEDQVYYTIFGDGLVYKCIWSSSKVARDRYALGNCFKTKEQAEIAAEKLKELFKSL